MTISPDAVAMLKECRDNIDDLTEWEQSFIESLWERYEKWNDDMFMSPKQNETLEKIHSSLK